MREPRGLHKSKSQKRMANLTSPLIQQTQESLQVIENSKSWLKKEAKLGEKGGLYIIIIL